MKNRQLLKEVKQFQKIAGIIKENTAGNIFKVGKKVTFRYEGEPVEFGKIVDIARNWEEATRKGGNNFDVWTDFWEDEEVWMDYGYDSFEEWEKDQIDPLKNNIWYKIEGEEGIEKGWFPAEYVGSTEGYGAGE
jgi:hypothetical protein